MRDPDEEEGRLSEVPILIGCLCIALAVAGFCLFFVGIDMLK